MKTDNEFIKKYEKIVKNIALQYIRVGEPLEDMMQDGFIGLIWAGRHFEETIRYKPELEFESYAAAAVRHEITKALREHGYIVKVPRRIAEETDHHVAVSLDACKEAIHEESNGVARHEKLYADIDTLSEKQRIVIQNLYGLEGRTRRGSKSLAIKMEISQNEVQHLHRRALMCLKKKLTE